MTYTTFPFWDIRVVSGNQAFESYLLQFEGSMRNLGTSRYLRDRPGMILASAPGRQEF